MKALRVAISSQSTSRGEQVELDAAGEDCHRAQLLYF